MIKKTALITGGASGMGLEFTQRMLAQGYQCAVFDQDEAGLSALQSLHSSSQLICLAVDVGDASAVHQAVTRIKQTFFHIDRLVTCAAIMPTGNLAEQSAELTNKTMKINYGGTVNIVRAAFPDMRDRNKGEVIIFGSSGGSVLMPQCGAYCASKAATNAYAETLMEENRTSNVHIMLVCPALVNTPLLDQSAGADQPPALSYSIKSKRFATAKDIIDAVEKGLAKKTHILKPGEAALMMWLRRFSPSLLWRLIRYTDKFSD